MNQTNKTPVLYSFRRCPFAMRARLVLAICGVACELREVALRDKPPQMLALSSKGEVPVLLLGDGEVLDESRAIMFWALRQNDPQNWLESFHEWGDAEMLDVFDNAFKHNLDRYKYATRYNAEPIKHRHVCESILTDLEQTLREGWLAGAQAGLLDVAVLPFVRQFRIAAPAWFDDELDLPNVKAWLARFLEWQTFEAVMQKYTSWQTGDTPILFNPKLD